MGDTTRDADASWRPRPWGAAGIRLLAYGIPVVAGVVAGRATAQALTDVHPLLHTTASLVAAVAASLLVSRLTMRLLPLAVLLKMTMIFPDRAPSRFKVARRVVGVSELRARLSAVERTEQEAAELTLALVTELGRHDRRTRGHSERVRLFCDLLADQLGLDEASAGRLRWAALVHDIGKLDVPVKVLAGTGKLDDEGWALIRQHPTAGARLAAPLAAWLGPWFAGIEQHHERYDGTGYPLGLSGSQISLAGRVVAVVDAFETMTAARSYKAARSTLSARAELAACAGSHFDPAVVRGFLAISLPRLLWSVGPLAFAVNAPFLRWVGTAPARVADAAGATASGAAQVAGTAAVALAVGAVPAPAVADSSDSALSRTVTSVTAGSDGRSVSTTTPAGGKASSGVRGDGSPGSHGPGPGRDGVTPPTTVPTGPPTAPPTTPPGGGPSGPSSPSGPGGVPPVPTPRPPDVSVPLPVPTTGSAPVSSVVTSVVAAVPSPVSSVVSPVVPPVPPAAPSAPSVPSVPAQVSLPTSVPTVPPLPRLPAQEVPDLP